MPSPPPIPEPVRLEAARWITEHEAGLLSVQGEAELARWLAADPMHRRAYARLCTTWEDMGSAAVGVTLQPDPVVVPMRAAVKARAKPATQRWVGGAIAASLALAVVGTTGNWSTRLQADAMTATGQQRDIVLPDGSRARLNTASALAVDYTARRQLRWPVERRL